MRQVIRIIQLSDIHLFADPKKRLLGLNTQDSFTAVLEDAFKKIKDFDCVFVTGDLSQDGSENSYLRLADQFSIFKKPIYWTTGNHDDLKSLEKYFSNQYIHTDKSLVINNWHFILLNSQIPGSVPGFLDKKQFAFLKNSLEKYPKHHTAIVFHHHPLPVGSRWLDNLGVKNANEFLNFIQNYPNIRTVIYGHVHQSFSKIINNVVFFSAPATCIQFKPDHDEFMLDIIPPGFRTFEFHPDGNVKSQVHRADNFNAYTDADPQSKGY